MDQQERADEFAHPQFEGYDKDFRFRWNKMTHDEWAASYDRAFESDVKNRGLQVIQPGRAQIHFSVAQAEVLQRLTGCKSVLDVGCWAGYMVCALNAQKVDAWGMDVSGKAVAFAQSHVKGAFKDKFVQVPPDMSWSLNGRKFQAVIAVETLEHVQDPEAFISFLWEMVEDGGHLIITVPKDGIIPSPYHIHTFLYQEVLDLIL